MGGLGIEVEELHHWPGKQNIADIATKGEAMFKDIAFSSIWQNGPEVLQRDRKFWPASREFKRSIPEEEKKPVFRAHVTEGGSPVDPKSGEADVTRIMQFSDNLDKVVSIVARIMAAQSRKE